MFELNSTNISPDIPFIVHANGLAEPALVDVPSVYPETNNIVFVDETFGAWRIVKSFESNSFTDSLLADTKFKRGGVYAFVSVSDESLDGELLVDCSVRMVLLLKK